MRTFTRVAAVGIAALLAACTRTPVEVRTVTIAGGEAVRIPMVHGDAKAVENADVKVELVGFVADREKQEIVYVFGFQEKKGAVPRAVTVEDVTGNDAEMLVADAAPHLSGAGYWTGKAAPQKKGDPSLAWLVQAGDTFKVFRLTITTADGRRLVLFQATDWGAALKAAFRQMLGYDAQPAT